jgi:tetratricopeptide (TPR) repeat protein
MKLTQYIAISIAIFSSIIIPEISIASTDLISVDRSTDRKIDLYIAQNNDKAKKYYESGNSKFDNDAKGALVDYNKAIALDPKLAVAYRNRGDLKRDKFDDIQGALADYNQAIALNPKFAGAYNNRGNLKKDKFDDIQGALADFNQAIEIDPEHADAYNNRGYLKKNKLNDRNGAIPDFRQAAKLYRAQGNKEDLQSSLYHLKDLGATENEESNSTNTTASNSQNNAEARKYYESGSSKIKFGDIQGALADFNQAIALDPEFVAAYDFRCAVKYKIDDRQGAIAACRQAVKLHRAQGNNDSTIPLVLLEQMGASEN